MARVLVVDDDPDIQELLVIVLIEHTVTTAESGAEALELIAHHHYDLLIVDAMMPDLDGYTLVRRVRNRSPIADVPVIMVTARSAEADHLRGFEEGVDAYITKPFDPESLIAVATQVLSRPPEERARIRNEEAARARLFGTIERRFGG